MIVKVVPLSGSLSTRDRPAEQLDDPVSDRNAQAAAFEGADDFVFGAEIDRAKLREFFRRHADAVVLHRDDQLIAVGG